jgi:endonuclease/exonuclease/phosphatase family metal-dependent hydrolase
MRLVRAILVVLSLAPVTACGDDSKGAAPPPEDGPATLTVLTQNLYLGAELEPLLSAGANLPAVVEQLWASALATDFPGRAKVLAQIIEAAGPDLVALQEVSLWRFQQPGDQLPTPNATTVQVDFLEVLLQELDARNLQYRVVGTVTNADFELPGASGTDYRLTDRDVLLGKRSLPVTATASGTYAHLATITVPVPIGPAVQLKIARGWVSADVRAAGRTVRVFDTHLEAFSAEVATQQVADLLQLADPAARPTVIAGDMNLPPGSAGYQQFLASGTRLRDAWAELHGGDPGLTCCWDPDLRDGTLETRIDLLFATPELRATTAVRLGEGARTPGGLFPSDHLGAVATFDPRAVATAATAMTTSAPAH